MKNLILLFLLAANQPWQYKRAVETWQDVAGKYRVKVLIASEDQQESLILKFSDIPTINQVMNEVNKVCIEKAKVPEIEPTIEELKQEIARKDEEIRVLKKKLAFLELNNVK